MAAKPSLLLTNIGELVTNDPTQGPGPGIVQDVALLIEGGDVVWAGQMRWAREADTAYDVGGRAVIPGFVDSHAHLMFAGDRASEFEARMTGKPYLRAAWPSRSSTPRRRRTSGRTSYRLSTPTTPMRTSSW